jgi:predicted nuclease with TOPRIM domain
VTVSRRFFSPAPHLCRFPGVKKIKSIGRFHEIGDFRKRHEALKPTVKEHVEEHARLEKDLTGLEARCAELEKKIGAK